MHFSYNKVTHYLWSGTLTSFLKWLQYQATVSSLEEPKPSHQHENIAFQCKCEISFALQQRNPEGHGKHHPPPPVQTFLTDVYLEYWDSLSGKSGMWRKSWEKEFWWVGKLGKKAVRIAADWKTLVGTLCCTRSQHN